MEYYPGLTLIRQPDLLIMDTFFLILTAIILLQSLLALGGTLRLLRFSLRKRQTGINRYQPKAVVIVPCKGLEHDFEENIKPLLNQEYQQDNDFIDESGFSTLTENEIDVKSDWFLLSVTTSIGTTQSTLYSLLERRGENVTVRLRSFDVK